MSDTHFPVESHTYQNGVYRDRGNHVVAEKPVSLSINGRKWLAFLCSPKDLMELAVGFLFNEGIIETYQDVKEIFIHGQQEKIDVWLNRDVNEPEDWRRTTGCSGGYTSAVLARISSVKDDPFQMNPEQITNLVVKLYHSQEIYKQAGGIHSSAISDGEKLIKVMEDVGRHNTLDKIQGWKQINDYLDPTPVLVTTGRVSSEMMQKASKIGAVLIITHTSPTSLSVELAEKLGVTLIGYARSNGFKVYTHKQRVAFPA